jgi:hypothetical protein
MKYKYDEDICGKNAVITEYIKRVSPKGYFCNLAKAEIGFDINNTELELMEEPMNEITNSNANSNANSSTKSKNGDRKNKKSKTKKRRSKRIAALRKSKK